MANKRSGEAKSGGGIKIARHFTGYKQQYPVSKAMSPEGVAQQGMALSFKRKPIEEGRGYNGPAAVPPTGVANARKGPAGAGPGGFGRTIYRTGAQSQYGEPAPNAVNTRPDVPATSTRGTRDILRDYGPEASGKK